MKIIPIIILSIFLSGCIFPVKPDEPSMPPAKPVAIDKAALEPCALLKEDIVLTSFPDLLVVYSDTATKYAECAKKQSNSIKLLKEFGGIK